MGGYRYSYSLRCVGDFPPPFRSVFTFRYFNSLQSECFPVCFLSDINMVVSAPTESGKTVLFELCILRLFSRFLTKEGKFNHSKGVLKTCVGEDIEDLEYTPKPEFEGVTSNRDAALLAETFSSSSCSTKVVGVPITLNGDLKIQFVKANVGSDTICKISALFEFLPPFIRKQLLLRPESDNSAALNI